MVLNIHFIVFEVKFSPIINHKVT